MLSGSVMQLLSGPVEAVSIRPIFIWWEAGATPSKLGTIFFNESTAAKEKTKVDGQSLPMNKISDVFRHVCTEGVGSCSELVSHHIALPLELTGLFVRSFVFFVCVCVFVFV